MEQTEKRASGCIELVGTSPASFAEAVEAAVAEASATVRHMDWFEVGWAG